jgi:hypothetical protein
MYERKVKKGAHKGKKGWGCPLCFLLLPEHKPKITGLFDMIKNIYLLDVPKKDKKPFDFWKKYKKDVPKSDDDDKRSE